MLRALTGTYLTKAWTALLGIVAVPFYARFLGPEAFGIVSFVVLVQSAVNLLDFGLSSSITRQVAMHHAAGEHKESAQTIRTLELVYWGIGAVIAIILLLGSQFEAASWLRANTLSPALVRSSLLWASLATASLWPMTFYSGALMGMAHYNKSNLVNALSLTLRQLGGAVIAWLTSGDLMAFFVWQFFANLIPVLIAAALVWRSAGLRLRSPTRWSLIRETRGFLSGMALATAAALLFTQLDKILLSRLMSLSEFGLYSLAWTAAGVFYMFYSPVASVALPRFSGLLAKGDGRSLSHTYHVASQIVAAGVLPTAAVLTVFPQRILTLWLHEKTMVDGTASLLQLLIPFAALGALGYIPAVFQWANGWTSLSSVTNLAASVLLAPCLWLAYRRDGVLAAILVWGMLRTGQAAVQIFLMHRRLLRGQLRRWLLRSVFAPAAVSFGVCLAWRQFVGIEPGMVLLATLWVVSVLVALTITPELRSTLEMRLQQLRTKFRTPGAIGLQMTPQQVNKGSFE